jgi:outer membrane protein OmpA-like peptidoglycan-associated protein
MKGIVILASIVSVFSYGQMENVGSLANSEYEELSPYVTPDGSKLFFIREAHPGNTDFGDTQDIWWCSLENDIITSEAKHLGFPFNTLQKNDLSYQSPDGQTRVIKGVLDNVGKFKHSGYSISRKTEKGWSDPEEMHIKSYDFMVRGKYVDMCMAPGGNVMILSFSEEKNSPNSELYLSRNTSGNDWTKPEKLNFTVPGDFGAFVAADGKTLYFSGIRSNGFGSSDIYVVHRTDDTWLNWSEPENLGPEINTAEWDAYFIVSPTGKHAFMTSTRGGSSDIYSFSLEKIKEEVKPDPVIIVEGKVQNSETGAPLSADLVYTDLALNSVQGIGKSASADGMYKLVLPYGNNFSINAQLTGFYGESIHLDLKDKGEFTTVKHDIFLKPMKLETVVRLNNVFFETGKWELLTESKTELDGLVKILTQNPTMKIELRGHTDNVGNDETNLTLSENRAKSVMTYLTEQGIMADRLTSKGFGETQPVTTNETVEGRQQNRRVEFIIQTL